MSEPRTPAELLPVELLNRLVGSEGSSPLEAIDGVAVPLTELEDFRPLGECLEWRLADQPGALAAIARGLAGDRHAHVRPRLLEKQSQVLTLLAALAAAEKARLARRAQRFA